MTTLEVSLKLYEWFESNDSFDLDKNFKNIFLISENEELDKATLIAGLKKLESQGVITGVRINEKSLFILSRPVDSIDQQVNIDYPTAVKVAKVINNFCESIEDYKDVADPAEIKTKDILHLALILEAWQKNKTDNVD
jgi:hypothetical protein